MIYKMRFLLVAFVLASCYIYKAPIVPEARKVYTLATVTEPDVFHVNAQSETVLEFHAKGKVYQTKVWTIVDVAKGEKYKLWYDSADPFNNNRILRSFPVFLTDEPTRKTECEVMHCNKKDYIFDFKYYVVGKKFKKLQVLPSPAANYPLLKKGAKYAVEYWVENPQRSILIFDSLRTDTLADGSVRILNELPRDTLRDGTIIKISIK